MPNSITNRQMVLILFLTLTSFTVVTIPKVMVQNAGTGSWITIIITSILFAVAAAVLVSLQNMFQGKTLFEYSGELVGRIGAYFLAVYFTQYFLTVLVNLNLSMVNLLRANFLPHTPLWATSLAALPVTGFVAYKGITNAARLVEIYGVIFIIIIVSVHLMMPFQGHAAYALPLYVPSEATTYITAIKDAIFPFLGIEVLAIIPFTANNGPKAVKSAFITLLLIGAFYILVVETSVMMVGYNEIVHYNYPLVVAIREVELPFLKIFQRIDLLYLTVGFIGLFAGLSIVYLNIVEYICRMLPKVKRGLVVIAVGLTAFLFGQAVQNIKDIEKTLDNIITYTGIATAILIPAALLTIAKVKKRANKKTA